MPPFTLVTIRASAADIIDRIAGGDIKAKQMFLGHKNLSTTERHYHSEESRRRAREALAVAIDQRERFAVTNGASDPRKGDNHAADRSAVTPGFRCLDPLFSPQPGQKDGNPCDAYGACPSCPLVFVNLADEVAYGRLVQLRGAIERAETEVHPQRWIGVWQPRLAALSEWIAEFPEATAKAAAGGHVSRIPRIE